MLGSVEPVQADAPAQRRTEPAVLPVVAGSTDIGVGAGAIGSLTRFEHDRQPWRWRLEAQAFAAAKSSPSGGVEVPYQEHYLRLDLPGRARAPRYNLLARFVRDAAAGYWGIGNAARSTPEVMARYHQIDWLNPSLGVVVREPLGRGFLAFQTASVAYSSIRAYPGSKLEQDQLPVSPVRPALAGLSDHGLAVVTAGLALDTRDHELWPESGMLHDLSLRHGRGFGGETLGYTGLDLTTRYYLGLWPRRLVLATRLMLDTVFGRPPVYELWRSGGLLPINAPGGGAGLRGVHVARFAGKLKALGNVELRSWLVRFGSRAQPFDLGAVAFADGGFVRAAHTPDPELDGSGLGLKYGVGGGLRLAWGQAFLGRGDAAWSPDGFGVYVDVGHAF